MFILRLADKQCFWHVYFRATVAGCSTPFFAELRGEEKPNEVTMCKIVDKYNGKHLDSMFPPFPHCKLSLE
jgi:hypothetical protein